MTNHHHSHQHWYQVESTLLSLIQSRDQTQGELFLSKNQLIIIVIVIIIIVITIIVVIIIRSCNTITTLLTAATAIASSPP